MRSVRIPDNSRGGLQASNRQKRTLPIQEELPTCDHGFIASEFLSPNRVSRKEPFEGLELCGNSQAQFLEGGTGAIPSGYWVTRELARLLFTIDRC
jgi:hypothetical protein